MNLKNRLEIILHTQEWLNEYGGLLRDKINQNNLMNEAIEDYHNAKLTIRKRTVDLASKHNASIEEIALAAISCPAIPEFLEFAQGIDGMNKIQAEYAEALLDAIELADDTIKKMLEISVWKS